MARVCQVLSQASVAQKEICEAPNLEVFCSNPVSSLFLLFLFQFLELPLVVFLLVFAKCNFAYVFDIISISAL